MLARLVLIHHTKCIKLFQSGNFFELILWPSPMWSFFRWRDSDPWGVINIADWMKGTFVFIKLDYLKNFMSNKCSMKCLWASENQRNWIFYIIYWALGCNQNHPNWNLANILAWKTNAINGLRYFIHFWKSFCLKLALNLSVLQTLHTTFVWHEIFQIT